MNIVFDSNDRLGRCIVMLESGAAWIKEREEEIPSPYTVVHSKVAVEILSFMTKHKLGLEDIKKLVKELK